MIKNDDEKKKNIEKHNICGSYNLGYLFILWE